MIINYVTFALVIVNSIVLLLAVKKFSQKAPMKVTSNEVLIDTCALIDGRILQIAKTGFIPSKLLIPDFVIAELQQLADGRDSLKRQRARSGLDMVKELQQNQKIEVEIVRPAKSDLEVDDQLVALAKQRQVALYTTDYNLNKVAEIEGVTVLNVNELSGLLRPVHLPGEKAEIKIVQKGQDKTQGIGYLEDGTMVVVPKAGALQNKKVKIEFVRHLQTNAGKMMFAKKISASNKPEQQTS